MSLQQPLYQTIEPDEPSAPLSGSIGSGNAQPGRKPVVLTPTNSANAAAQASPSGLESGKCGIGAVFKESSHPLALLCLYLFRIAAISVYILCGLFTDNYVLSTVLVVVLLAMDFWNCRNVAGRTLVGLRYWNQVDEDGESYWVFESRDPSRPANPVDSRLFWIALYTFPVLWGLLFIVSIFRFNLSYALAVSVKRAALELTTSSSARFLPIVGLAIVFNVTNAIGFTYADRDAKQRWASSVGSGWGVAGVGGQILGSMVTSGIGRLIR
ncbi:Golgi apparatus membrane protein tvp23 [Tulasnella sp. 425]|nr:Golgi apparatus membrane protein tvp23 [Tulasnella sp. 425]